MSKPYTTISLCRCCAGDGLEPVLALGGQAIGSRFPGPGEPDPPVVPMTLVRCTRCALVQLLETTDSGELYTYDYGYRSGTNASMRDHLAELVGWVTARARPQAGDAIIDIGCNDGTLLKSYSVAGIGRFGIDPIVGKFADHYPDDIGIIEDFFGSASCDAALGGAKAKVITSISMFYDLPDPNAFVAAIARGLADEGVWVLEQSYLPSMLATNSFDTVCHEHLEYYALAQIEWLARAHGLRVFDAARNACNGGSFRLAVCHRDAAYGENEGALGELRALESGLCLDTPAPFDSFRQRLQALRQKTRAFVEAAVAAGKTIYLYGASTKGNTLLQYYGLDRRLIAGAAERNPQKYGHRTPATAIPIVAEAQMRAAQPDYLFVLPWHFRDEFIAREAAYRKAGGQIIFPLPEFEIVGNGGG